MLPSLFLAHGTPSLAIESHGYAEFLKEYVLDLPIPKAIVILSAHWESREQMITAVQTHDILYDFAGFSEELYSLTYPAPGTLDLADHILTLLAKAGVFAMLDNKRPLDHGAWVPLRVMYPEANIPVIPLSINPTLSNNKQYEIGKALSALRSENVLIIGSGGIVHNPDELLLEMDVAEGWALCFEEWVEKRIREWDLNSLFNYELSAPFAKAAVPTKEHFAPLLIAMGAGHENKDPRLLHRCFQYGNLSLSAWEF
ncbi:class III extradiol ring-cleavage dioxygenase [Bacillus sp. CECT 9360]|uniref:DODA-type extradiol aromatic ring-opening family dioxygenase n=1 Tax=Bacillus sp. CECT 9360 TaxID=2845821 RepID=UPI001E3D9942|nr:class III extradiol ring-cleavage dioxygenase [Bacillus sp. CECT 9360]CAH0347280.1 4,5-DOPA dioxygenase extradiol [Bacillus sp. CECT 9360]